MLVKALKNFCGKVCMAVGEEKNISDGKVLKDLLSAGYVEKIKNTKDKGNDETE